MSAEMKVFRLQRKFSSIVGICGKLVPHQCPMKGIFRGLKPSKVLVAREGFEPPTQGIMIPLLYR